MRRAHRECIADVGRAAWPVATAAWRFSDEAGPLVAAATCRLEAWAQVWRGAGHAERLVLCRALGVLRLRHAVGGLWRARATGLLPAILATLERVGVALFFPGGLAGSGRVGSG